MPLVRAERVAPVRARLVRVTVSRGLLGLALLIAVTVWKSDEPVRVVAALDQPQILIPLLAFFTAALAFLKFPLSEDIFVSPAVAACMAMIPILGVVLSSWIAVAATVAARSLGVSGIGPTKLGTDDRALDWLKVFGLVGTYGVPMLAAGLTWSYAGGVAPLIDASAEEAGRIAVAEIVFMLANIAVLTRMHLVLGYSTRTIVKMSAVDTAIYLLALPYSILIAYSWVALGFRGLLPTLFTGALATVAVRSLAAQRTANRDIVQRLASLSNIATALSVKGSREELLRVVYEECSRVLDTSLFTIATYDEVKGELHFELEVRNGVILPQSVAAFGDGLNSWVIENRRPLLIRNSHEERRYGVRALKDGIETEAWLGVPMIVQDRIIGVISVQNFGKDAFTEDDLLLLKTVASQTAAAMEDARLYARLESANTELEQRVAERTAELRETNIRLVAADRAKTQFLANMSHELRTPLNSIIGFANVLHAKTRDSIAPRLHGFLQNIITSGTHLLTLINDLLDLAKVEAGKMTLNVEPVDVHAAVQSVERVVRGMAADAEVSLLCTVDRRLHTAEVDEVRLKQILINLLSNAIKFSERGAFVRLHCELVDAVTSELGVNALRLVVEDYGAGIDPAHLPKIFDEFYQAGDARSRVGGTGLGLPLTRRFVEMHSGTIAVESQPGVGTTFSVELPIAARPRAPRRMSDSGAIARP